MTLTALTILGTDESGMSTLLKQMQIAYAPDTITATELESVRYSLFSNLVVAFMIVLEEIDEIEWKYGASEIKVQVLLWLANSR